MDYENHIIDYIAGDELKLAFVVRQQKNKLQTTDLNGRNDRVTLKQILIDHGTCTEANFSAKANELLDHITAIGDDIDTELLWESVQDNTAEFSITDFTEEYFGDCSSAEQAALARQVMADSIRFRRKGPVFIPRSHEDVQNQITKQLRAAEQAAILEQANQWIQKALKTTTKPVPVPKDLEDFMGKVAAFILQDHRNNAIRMITELFPRDNPRQIGCDLLKITGRLPDGADHFLLVNGIIAGFSEAVETHAANLNAFNPQPERLDFCGIPTVSIDDPDTREVDDAISLERDNDHLIVGIHIADPAVFVHRNDPLDRVAGDRALTLYLPTKTVTMLPVRIGCDLASLNQDTIRPTISFRIQFTHAGELADWSLHRGQIRVTERLTYDHAEKLMTNPESATGTMLAELSTITDKLRLDRLKNGALQIKRPELKVHVKDDQIHVTPLQTDSPARNLVSELMILINRLAAEFALSNDVPIIYRTQPPPSNPVKPMDCYDPVTFNRTVRNLKRTRLTTHPEPHAGLGLDVYTQVSSPIRRFADLIIQRQLAAHLADEPYPYQATEIIEVLTNADAIEGQNRKLERAATRYWLLEHLRRSHNGTTIGATVLDHNQGGIFAELDTFCLQGRLTNNARHKPGTRINVTINKVDPEKDLLILTPA